MSENFIFWLFVGCGVLLFLMIFKPIRQLVLNFFGAKSIWGLLWAVVAEVFVAHWTVIRNFLPRSVIYPSLDTKRSTNAE